MSEPDGAEQFPSSRDESSNVIVETNPPLECSVCLQPCVHPVQLPCRHIFCFLCVKGVAGHGRRCCALCRADIPPSFFDAPRLLSTEDLRHSAVVEHAIEGKYQWYYQGGQGWWQYEQRCSKELEEKYQAGVKEFEMMISGFVYVVDLENRIQYRRSRPSRRRHIKRDVLDIPDRKGIAGIACSLGERSGGDGGEERDEGGLKAAGGARAYAVCASSVRSKGVDIGAEGDDADVARPEPGAVVRGYAVGTGTDRYNSGADAAINTPSTSLNASSQASSTHSQRTGSQEHEHERRTNNTDLIVQFDEAAPPTSLVSNFPRSTSAGTLRNSRAQLGDPLDGLVSGLEAVTLRRRRPPFGQSANDEN